MNEIDFESEDGRKFKVPEDQVENFMAMAKSEGLKLKGREKPAESTQANEPTIAATKNEPKLAFKGSNGKRYEVPENRVDEFKQKATNEGFTIEPWKKREDIGVSGHITKQAELKQGRRMGFWSVLQDLMPFAGSVAEEHQQNMELSEQGIYEGKVNDPQEIFRKAQFHSPNALATAIESVKRHGGEMAMFGGVKSFGDEEAFKNDMREFMKQRIVERTKTRNEVRQELEDAEPMTNMQKVGAGTVGIAKMLGEYANRTAAVWTMIQNYSKRKNELMRNEYTLDENDNPVIAKRKDGSEIRGKDKYTAGEDAAKSALTEFALFGTGILGRLMKFGGRQILKIPGADKLAAGMMRGSAGKFEELAAKMNGCDAGRRLQEAGKALWWLTAKKLHVGTLPIMMTKMRMTELVDEVLGANVKDGDEMKLKDWIKNKLLSKDDNVEMFLGIIGIHMLMAGGSGAYGWMKNRNERHRPTKEYGVGKEEVIKSVIGEDLAKKLGTEDLNKIFQFVANPKMTPEIVETFFKKINEDRTEAEKLIKNGERLEDVMKGMAERRKNNETLEAAARKLHEELKKGPIPEQSETPAERAAGFMERFWNGQIKTFSNYSLDELETKDEARIGGARKTTGEEDTRPVIVFEKSDGTKELITGKKRVETARAKGEAGIDAVVIREEEGWTPEEARNLNTFENLHQGGLSVKDALKAVQRLGIKSDAELDLFGIDGQEAEIAVRIANEASNAVKAKIEKDENVDQILETGMLDTLTMKNCGERRDGLQQVVLDRVIGKMGAEEAKRVIEVLKERDVDPTDAKAVDEAIAEGRSRASEGKPVADVEPVETPSGEMRTLGEVLGTNKARSGTETGDSGTARSETPIFDAASESGTNKGVELKDDGAGVKSCARFPGVEIKVTNGAVIVRGMDSDVMTRPENLADTAALLKEIQKVRDAADPDGSKGVRILIDSEKPTGWIGEIAEVLKSEGDLAYSNERFDMRSEVIRRLCESTGVKTHADAKSWEWVCGQNGIKAWSNSSRGTYGCYYRGEIYLNPTSFRAGAPIHEYGHVAIEIARKVNPKLIEKGLELVKTDEWGKGKLEEIKKDSIYGLQDEATQLEEVIAHLIETRGEKLLAEKGLGEKLKAWIVEVWKAIGNELGLADVSEERIANMSLGEVADTLLADMMSGRRMGEGKETVFNGPRASSEGSSNGVPDSQSDASPLSLRRKSGGTREIVPNNGKVVKARIQKFNNHDFAIDVRKDRPIGAIIKSICTTLNLRQKGSYNSHYGIFETPDGKVAFRVSTHKAAGKNFEQDNAQRNTSVVIETFDVKNEETAIPYEEFVYPKEIFDANREKIVAAILNGVDRMIDTGRFEDSTGLAEYKNHGGKFGRRVGVGDESGTTYKPIDKTSEELAKKAGRGDKKALGELYARHPMENAIKAYIEKKWGLAGSDFFNKQDIEEIESRAWLKVSDALKRTSGTRIPLKTIYFKQVEWTTLHYAEEKYRNGELSLDEKFENAEGETNTRKIDLREENASSGRDWDEFLKVNFNKAQIRIIQAKVAGWSDAKIAKAVGMPESAVKVILTEIGRKVKRDQALASTSDAGRQGVIGLVSDHSSDLGQEAPGLNNNVDDRPFDDSRKHYSGKGKNGKIKEQIVELSEQGLSRKEIRDKIGITKGSLDACIKQLRIEGIEIENVGRVSIKGNEAARLYKQGLSRSEIAKRLGTTPLSVGRMIHDARKRGIEIETQMPKHEKRDEIVALNRTGMTNVAIAERLGISPSTVGQQLMMARRAGEKTLDVRKYLMYLGRTVRADKGTIDGDVFVHNPGAWKTAESEIEQKPSGLAAAIERRDALRPYTRPGSPADRAEPIAFDAAELIGFMREIAGAPGVPRVKESGAVSSPSEKRIEMLARVFGVVDKSDVEHEKEKCRSVGLFAFEDPAWCAGRDPKEINANVKNSWTALNKMMRSLFKKRVLTGEGGEHRATQVLASEIGNMLLEKHVDGGHSSGVGAGRTMAEFIRAELTKPEHRGALKELERLVAWWHGQDECPAEIKGNGSRLTGEAIGILLTQPESMARETPGVYGIIRSVLALHEDAAEAYEKFCRMRWNGKADDRLMKDLEKTWDEETGRKISALEEKTQKPSQSVWDDLTFALHDRFGPIFAIPKRAIKAMKARHDRLVAQGRMTRSEAQMRESKAEGEIVTLKSRLYDYQRSSEGEERLMVEGFSDVINRAKEDGVDWRMVRRYAHLMRVIEIGGRATAFGIAPDRAARLLERLKENTGKEEYLKIEKTWKAFRAVYERFVVDDPRIMEMFDRRTQRMLRDNTHYVTMRHTMTKEEMEGYEQRLEEYRKGNEIEDPSLDIYMRLSHGEIGKADEREGFGLRPLKGSFEATKDPIAETIKRAIEIKRAAIRNQLVRDLRTVLVDSGVKDVFENFKGKFRSDSRFGSLMYMEDGAVKRLVVPKVIESSFKASNQAPGRAAQWIGGATRALKNTMTIWNPAFLNRAYMMDKASLEANVEGLHKDVIAVVTKALSLRIPGTCIDTALPLYAVDNYLSRFTDFGQTWIGKLLYNEHTVNHYARQAQKIAEIVYEGKFGERLKEAERLRSIGKSSEAAEIEQNVMTAKEMMRRNVFQSKYNFDKVQSAVTPKEVLAAYGIGEVEWKKMKGIEKAWAAAKKGGSWINRYGEEQEAVSKIIAWLYAEKMNPGGDADARARFAIEQGGTPNLGARGIWASWIENATGFFWNVRKQAAVRSWDAFKDHKTEWAVKAIAQTMLPGVVKGLCVMGGLRALAQKFLFDDDEKKMKESALEPVLQYYDWYGQALRNVPSYVQKNYNVIPICTFEGGGTLALRLKWAPEEFAVQNLVHAAMNKWMPDPTDPNADFTTAAKGIAEELLPLSGSENPMATMFKLVWNPLFGMNVRDEWRGRDIYSDDAIRARWTAPKYIAGEMGRNLWNYSPLGNFVMGIADEKDTGGTPIPPTLGRVLYGCPILSRLPASVLGFYADPEKGALGGMIQKDKDIIAKVRLQSGEILQKLMRRGGSLEKIDEVMKEVAGDEIEPELKMQYYKLVVMGWRQWMKEKNTPADVKLWKKANAIKDGATRLQAMEYVERAMREDD